VYANNDVSTNAKRQYHIMNGTVEETIDNITEKRYNKDTDDFHPMINAVLSPMGHG